MDSKKICVALDLENKSKMDAFRKAEMDSRKALNAIPKKIEVDQKKLASAIKKATLRIGAKMVPVVGIGFGIFETGRRLLQGDFTGAAIEAASIPAASAIGLPLDITNASRDIYRGTYGTDYEADLAANPTVANQRLGAITKQLSDSVQEFLKGKETASDGAGVTPDPSRAGGGMFIAPQIVDASRPSSFVEQNINATNITNVGKPRGIGIGLVQ